MHLYALTTLLLKAFINGIGKFFFLFSLFYFFCTLIFINIYHLFETLCLEFLIPFRLFTFLSNS